MVEPLRPKPAAWRTGKILVADVVLQFAEDYMPGDRYQTVIVLSRSLDAYEQRATELEPLAGYRASYDQLTTNMHVDDIDPLAILAYLERIASLGADRRQQAVEEQQRLTEHAQKVKSVLRPRT